MNESDSFLQRFFDASLIPADTTDERLGHYQAAAADLAKRFGAARRDAVSASRVAIDPKCPATEPWFATVQEAVKTHWKTFLVNHHDAPRQICRAILLEALSKAAEDDEELSAAIWNSTSNLLPHFGTGPEQDITREFISGLGDKCETYSSSIWRIGGNSALKQTEFAIKTVPMKTLDVDQTELEHGMSDAAGPQNQKGQSFGDPNPQWPNTGQSWSYQFAPRAAKSIATEVNKALTAIPGAIKRLTDQLGPALNKHASALSDLVIASVRQNERFTTLLWWKQTLYSPKLQRSYRDLGPTPTAVAMAFDLPEISGAPVPQSAEFFLREAIKAAVPENPRLTLAELAIASKTSAAVEPILPAAPSVTPCRVSLREFLRLDRECSVPPDAIPAYLGIDATTALPVTEWGIWLLRERLAEILSNPEA